MESSGSGWWTAISTPESLLASPTPHHRTAAVIICDPKHPALAEFPTEFHSNWQWWQIVKNSRPIILDETPADYRPIIHVIDNFARNHKLGLLFETKVGKGKLLVCASDLPALQAHPEARQLMHSLLRYVDAPAFAPTAELDGELLKKLLTGDTQ